MNQKYLFYPGCSMQRNARAYLDSLRAIEADLTTDLEELRDWNCCGATEYSSVNLLASHALVGRNLALAAEQADDTNNRTVVASCSACYLNLAKTDHYMRDDRSLKSKVNDALSAGSLSYEPGAVKIRHLLDIIYHDIGLEAIRERVVRPLSGLRVAPYYGCLIVRPDYDHRFGNPEYPTALDKVMEALGAEVVDYPLKTHCCGGHMTQISPPTAYELIRRLVHAADQYAADLLVTVCPMCQLNLDAYQNDTNAHFETDYHMPVLYFTQLMGVAFGYDAHALGLGREFVSAREALAKIGVEIPGEEEEKPVPQKRRRRRDDPTLPMPARQEKRRSRNE